MEILKNQKQVGFNYEKLRFLYINESDLLITGLVVQKLNCYLYWDRAKSCFNLTLVIIFTACSESVE